MYMRHQNNVWMVYRRASVAVYMYACGHAGVFVTRHVISLLLWASRWLREQVGCTINVSGTFRVPLLFPGLRRFVYFVRRGAGRRVLFCSLAVLDPRVGHTMDVLSPFIPVLCHSDWLFHRESCPRIDVVHPGRVWPSSPWCTWHCFLHYLYLQAAWYHFSMSMNLENRQQLSDVQCTLRVSTVI